MMNNHKPPTRQEILVKLDQMSRARIVQPLARFPHEKQALIQAFSSCAAWLELQHIAYHYDQQIRMYVLDHAAAEATIQ
ncbi:hypothetical protein EPA93_10530 [Ktedonosporobacter rubrisoli]|uniref:Uncharacterized protein n=1 Tax=Ktedonosporobacter rubrisoli TaxID=2509675 RepID=A0A4V0YYJ3_KTERU|nr:hypothetical protein [Ktedonosporobacter rubrisoli]QBD76421.1 hypothetical protein EPA93_10530 [Ktedonosporobacter rubrisoli]